MIDLKSARQLVGELVAAGLEVLAPRPRPAGTPEQRAERERLAAAHLERDEQRDDASSCPGVCPCAADDDPDGIELGDVRCGGAR